MGWKLCAAIVLFSSACHDPDGYGSSDARLASADWYLKGDQGTSASWETLTSWVQRPDGTGTNPASIAPTDDFDANGALLRTPVAAGTTEFGGGALELGGGSLLLKASRA